MHPTTDGSRLPRLGAHPADGQAGSCASPASRTEQAFGDRTGRFTAEASPLPTHRRGRPAPPVEALNAGMKRSRPIPGRPQTSRERQPDDAGGQVDLARACEPASPGRPAPDGSGRLATYRFVQACVEVVNGVRPATQLLPLTGPIRFPGIVAQLTRPTDHPRPTMPHEPVRLRRIRVCEPTGGVAEAVAILDHNGRSWAMAVRLERELTGWRCALIQMVSPGAVCPPWVA